MSITFFKDNDGCVEYKRGYAHGLTTFSLGEGVVSGTEIQFAIDGDKLIASLDVASDVGDIAFIGSKFGLVGAEIGLESKLSIILLGGDKMLVTLYSGALILELDDKLFPVAIGSVPSGLDPSPEKIDWVSRKDIWDYISHFDASCEYPYDYEFVLTFKGQKDWGRVVHHYGEEDADISCGYIAKREAELIAKRRSRELTGMVNSIFGQVGFSGGLGNDEVGYDEDDDGAAAFYAMEAEGDEDEYLGVSASKSKSKRRKKKVEEDDDGYYYG